MKQLKKILLVFAILLIVLLGTAIALPILFKDDIVRLVKSELNKSVNAQVNFNESIGVSLLKSFPNLNVSITNLTVTGNNYFVSDTLISAEEVSASINLLDLFKEDKITLNSLILITPDIKMVSKDTLANWDIFIESADTTTSVSPGTDFNKLIIQNGRFRYLDSASQIVVDVKDISGTVNGQFYNSVFDASTNFSTSDLLISYDGIPYLENIPVKGDAIISADLNNDHYTFKDNQFYTGDLLLLMHGGIAFVNEDDMHFDLNFGTSKAKFQEFLSLIPSLYKKDLESFKADGFATLSGHFKGLYSLDSFPGYALNLKINDGNLQYNASSDPLKKINVDLQINNPDGITDNTIVDLKNLSFVMRNETFITKLFVKTPISDPYMDGMIKGKIHLNDFSEFLPKESGVLVQGDIDADVVFVGNYSAAKAQNFQKFKSSGTIKGNNLGYKSADLPETVQISTAEIQFNERNVTVPTLAINAGKSDMLIGGAFDNIFGYLLNGEMLTGNFRLNSNQIRAVDFVKPEPATEASNQVSPSESTNDLIVIPSNLALNIEGNVGHLEYDEYKLDNAILKASLKDRVAQIEQLSTKFMKGDLSIKGAYNTSETNNTFTDLTLTAQDFDIATIFKSFETIRILAPVAAYAQGKFSTTLKLNTRLLSDFSPDLSNMNCSGILDLFNVDLKGLKAVNELGSKLKNDAFTKPIKILDLLLSFNIKDGRVNLAPFSLPIGESILRLEGSTALDQSIAFKGLLSIPKALYEQNAKSYNSYIPQNKWVDLQNMDFKDLLFDLDIFGNFTKPQVKLNFQNINKGIGSQIVDRAKSEIEAQRKLAEERARMELEKARAQADKAKNEAEEAAKKAIEEEKRKVEERIAQEKEAAKKKLADELKKKQGDVFKRPD